MAKKNETYTLKNPGKVMKLALKFASKDESLPILGCVHLDEDGSAVSTDSYRLLMQHKVWDGPSVTIEREAAEWLASLGAKCPSAEITVEGERIVLKASGKAFDTKVACGTYPNYKQLLKHEWKTVCCIDPKLVVPVLKEHARNKRDSVVSVSERDLFVHESGGIETSVRLEKHCDGPDVVIGFNPKYLKEALEACGKEPILNIEKGTKAAMVSNRELTVEVLLMPVMVNEVMEIKRKEQQMKDAKKMQAKKELEAAFAKKAAEELNEKPKTAKPKPEPKAAKPEPTKRKPKAPKAAPIEKHVETVEPPKVEQVAEAVTLATIEAWAKEHGKRIKATEGYTVKVFGVAKDEKELGNELKQMGFRWKPAKQVWWLPYPA